MDCRNLRFVPLDIARYVNSNVSRLRHTQTIVISHSSRPRPSSPTRLAAMNLRQAITSRLALAQRWHIHTPWSQYMPGLALAAPPAVTHLLTQPLACHGDSFAQPSFRVCRLNTTMKTMMTRTFPLAIFKLNLHACRAVPQTASLSDPQCLRVAGPGGFSLRLPLSWQCQCLS